MKLSSPLLGHHDEYQAKEQSESELKVEGPCQYLVLQVQKWLAMEAKMLCQCGALKALPQLLESLYQNLSLPPTHIASIHINRQSSDTPCGVGIGHHIYRCAVAS